MAVHRLKMSCDAGASYPQSGLQRRHCLHVLEFIVKRGTKKEVDAHATPHGTFKGCPNPILSLLGIGVVLRRDKSREHKDIAASRINYLLETFKVISAAEKDLLRSYRCLNQIV